MKIVFMGTPDFASGVLKAICERSKHTVTAVVTQPDRPKGRSGAAVASPVKEYALARSINVIQPEKIKTAEEVERLKKLDADIFVVAAFGQILSKEILDIPKYGCVNVHASLLPEYRGAAPIQWAIADGKKVTGVTIQQMNEGVDTGDIISSVEVAIADDETGGSLFDRLMEAGADLIVKTLDSIEEGSAVRTPQDESKATYAKMLKKEMGLLDFTKPAEEIERLVRAFTPWPGGYTYLSGKLIKIKGCKAVRCDNTSAPGVVASVTDDSVVISCGKDALAVTMLQAEGKRAMSTHDFLLGNPVKEGDKFGQDA